MRIKDSDDYLTARAANPRTGQISPSVVGTPKTPETPGAALKAHALQLIKGSPSPIKRLNGLRLANEGKKLKEGATASWLATGGTFRGTDSCDLVLPTMASKPVARKIFNANMEQQMLHDDEFVVKMPSAREPQPYSFPGSSGNEIEAFEHYKRKTKRTSGDGYDRRLLVDGHQDSAPVSPSKQQYQIPQQVSAQHPAVPPLHIVKRRQAPDPTVIGRPPLGSFVPYQSPKSQQKSSFEQFVATSPLPGAYRNFSPESLSPVWSSSLGEDMRAEERQNISTAAVMSCNVVHLNQLPRVHLVHPSLAATPSSPVKDTRSCSLGCSRNSSNNTCIETRKPSLQAEVDKLSLFAEGEKSKPQLTQDGEATLQLVEIIMLAVSILWQHLRAFILAHTSSLGHLLPQDLTTWEKLMIVKSLFSLLVKLTAVSIVIAITWKLTGLAIQMLKLVFWPLDMIVRTARWIIPA